MKQDQTQTRADEVPAVPEELVGHVPNLFFIGGKRCGSTTIHNMLAQHPNIYGTLSKEPNFFIAESMRLGTSPRLNDLSSAEYVQAGKYRTVEKYKTLFDDQVTEKFALESSHYLYHSDVIPIIKAWQPDARIIVSLRHPVDRVFSDYLFDVRDGRINCSFEQYFERSENARFKGKQAEFLRPWIEAFGRDRLFIIVFDQLKTDPAKTIRRVFDWLSLDADVDLETIHSQKSGVPKNRTLIDVLTLHHPIFAPVKKLIPKAARMKMRQKVFAALLDRPEMADEMRREVMSWYVEDIKQLMELTGLDLSAWLTDAHAKS